VAGLRLEAVEFADLTRWRWVLTDEASGALIADHEVRLDAACWQFDAFADVHQYLAWQVAPDRRDADEARVVGQVGEWIGAHVLGPVADTLVKLARKRPMTVRVVVPEGAGELLLRPLELAHVNGKPLAVQDVTLVMQVNPDDPDPCSVGTRLRVLGLFSLPDGGQPLNLRRERHSLVRVIRAVAAVGKAADVRVLQYGVTRERLRDVLEESEGWDIIHISGHGMPGELLLETLDGRPDRVTAADLADLLDLAREHVKLVTVAACWSAALTAAEQRRLLGLPVQDRGAQNDALGQSRRPADGGSSSGALATELSARMGCAVLAMRYPVDDEFAIALTGKLYDLLARQGQSLPRAVGMTLRQLVTGAGAAAFPALSVATPALFGVCAIDLKLAAPARVQPSDYNTVPLKMAGFLSQPDRFVGRTAVMARASAALAAESGTPGYCCTGCLAAGRPPARWSWRTPMRMPSTASSGTRPQTRAWKSEDRLPTSHLPWNATFLASK
jgi:hypothetical protein